MRKLNKKTVAIAAGAILVASGTGVAYAYWTSTGSGTGTATTGTTASLTVAQVGAPTGLAPGSAAQPLDFTVTNPGTGVVQISNVVIGFGTFPAGGCSSADYALTQPSKPSVATPLAIPAAGFLAFTSAGTGATGGTGAAIAMVNTTANQNSCKDIVVPLTYTVN